MTIDMNFERFVQAQREGFRGVGNGDRYAFSQDLKLMTALRRVRMVELAAESVVRLGRQVMAGELLGTAVKVGPRQYRRVWELTQHCANTLGLEPPTVYVEGRIDQVNAMTYGTDREAVIRIHGIMLDFFTDDELLFVLGHECGHIHNKHVVYLTLLELTRRMLGVFAEPAALPLRAWSRAAEITCDRAGLLCCPQLEVAQNAFLKLVTGTKARFDALNVEAYMEQLAEEKQSLGRAAELHKTHPYIPKRIEALKLFCESELFRRASGLPGGRPLQDIDREVSAMLSPV